MKSEMTEIIERLTQLSSKATPGPWEVRKRGTEVVTVIGDEDVSADGRLRCWRLHIDVSSDHEEADSELIAAVRTNLDAILAALKAGQAMHDFLVAESLCGCEPERELPLGMTVPVFCDWAAAFEEAPE